MLIAVENIKLEGFLMQDYTKKIFLHLTNINSIEYLCMHFYLW